MRSSVGSKPNEEPEEPLEVRVSPPGAPEPISSIGLRASPRQRVGEAQLEPADRLSGGSAIIRYEYRYAATGEAWSEWEKVASGDRRGVTVGRPGQRPGVYLFEVRAVNDAGEGRGGDGDGPRRSCGLRLRPHLRHPAMEAAGACCFLRSRRRA